MNQEISSNEPKSDDINRGNKIALYVSCFSTDGQYASMLEKKLRDEVESLNQYRNLGEIVEVFKDQGMPFELSLRPALQALLHAVLRKQVTLVMVPEFRDLSSRSREVFDLFRFFDEHGCGLRSLNEKLL